MTHRDLWNGPTRRALLLKWAVCLGLLTEMGLCPKLWLGPRSFPTAPLFSGLPDLPFLAFGFVAALLAVLLLPKPRPAIVAALLFGAALAITDQTRLQPWFYQSLLVLLALCWDDPRTLRSAALIFPATYLWSGLQKANLSFGERVFPWLLHPLHLDALSPFWPLAPLFEISIAILLFIPKTRAYGIAAAIAMHTFLLAALGPFGANFNSVVWPWNLWAPLLAGIAFFRNPTPLLPTNLFGKAILVLPALNFIGLWDDNLSASLYSGRTRQAFILVPPEAVPHLTPDLRSRLTATPGRIGLDLTRWSLADLNVPPYPEVRAFQSVAHQIQTANPEAHGLILLIGQRPGLAEAKSTYRQTPIP